MFIKLDEEKYIIPIEAINNVKKILEQVATKRERLIEKKQITDDDFKPLVAEFKPIKKNEINDLNILFSQREELEKHYFKNVIMTLSGDIPSVKQWNILGFIEPVLGQKEKYTLHSYNSKDLPKEYRDLENPSKCEHCDTNRKRNQTFIIQNKESKEMLQVGSSCMKDFISSQELGMLMSFSNIFSSVKEKSLEIEKEQKSVTFLNKEEFLATLLAMEEYADEGIDVSSYSNGAKRAREITSLVFNYFDYLEDADKYAYVTHPDENKSDFFSELNISDDHYDRAEEIVDFFENLDATIYKDVVFNTKEIVGSDMDFLSQKECEQVFHAVFLHKTISEKTPDVLNYLSNYQEGVVIGDKIEILPQTFNKDDFVATLTAIGKKDGAYTSYSASTPLSPNDVEKAILALSPLHKEKHIQNLHKQGYSDEAINNFSNKIDSYEVTEEDYDTTKNIIKFFKENFDIGTSHYQTKMKDIIKKDDEKISHNDAKYIGYIYHFYKEKNIKLEIAKEVSEQQELGFLKHIGAAGDRIEEIELKYKSNKLFRNDMYGDFFVHRFEDIHGNIFTASSTKKNPFESDEENINDKWISLAATIKGHRNDPIDRNNKSSDSSVAEKNTQLNRIKPLSEFKDAPEKNGEITLKGKYTLTELKIENTAKNKDSLLYDLTDKDGKKYNYLTKTAIPFEKEQVFESAIMLSQNGTDILNINKESLNKKHDFLLAENKELTPKQLEKHIKVNNAVKEKETNKIKP